mmetsp:Transcript_17446/g.51655  ORF Transcript_17446/g.51655 Transcript_17446/m.51655 type:complete len:499 (+) Transcript_17446:377-1873(+)
MHSPNRGTTPGALVLSILLAGGARGETTPTPLTVPPTVPGPTVAPTTLAPTGINNVVGGRTFELSCGLYHDERYSSSREGTFAKNIISPDEGVPEVWYRFEAPIDGRYSFSTCSDRVSSNDQNSNPLTEFDTRVTVFRRNHAAYGEQVGSCDDCGPCGTHATLDINLTVGEYWVVVDARADAAVTEGNFHMVTRCPTPTEGALECGATVIGSIVGQFSYHGWGGTGDHFYTFEAAVAGEYTFRTCGSEADFYTVLSLFRQAPNVTAINRNRIVFSTEIQWIEQQECDSCGTCPDSIAHSSLRVTLAAGSYAIGVEGYDDSEGVYRLTTTCPDAATAVAAEALAPPTDGVLTCGGRVAGTTVGGVDLVDADVVRTSFTTPPAPPGILVPSFTSPLVYNTTAPERWYAFTAPTTGRYTFDTCGSEANTFLHIFTRQPATGLPEDRVAMSDTNRGCGFNASNARIQNVRLAGGATYWVVVDGPGVGVDSEGGVHTHGELPI